MLVIFNAYPRWAVVQPAVLEAGLVTGLYATSMPCMERYMSAVTVSRWLTVDGKFEAKEDFGQAIGENALRLLMNRSPRWRITGS